MNYSKNKKEVRMRKKYLNSHKFLRNLNSQAALEFLTTYAWAFVVILISIGVLYYFGIFDFSKFLPQKCIFQSQFECIDFSFVGDEVRLRLVNNIGETLNVTGLDITNDAVNPLSCVVSIPFPPPSPITPFEWKNGLENDFVFASCQNGAFIVRERTEAKITITYYAINTPSQPIHTVKGKITAVVNSP